MVIKEGLAVLLSDLRVRLLPAACQVCTLGGRNLAGRVVVAGVREDLTLRLMRMETVIIHHACRKVVCVMYLDRDEE